MSLDHCPKCGHLMKHHDSGFEFDRVEEALDYLQNKPHVGRKTNICTDCVEEPELDGFALSQAIDQLRERDR